jgi:hypothetical protein
MNELESVLVTRVQQIRIAMKQEIRFCAIYLDRADLKQPKIAYSYVIHQLRNRSSKGFIVVVHLS